MDLPNDWSEFLSSLDARRVRYLVIGAHALAAHGAPRFTADLDVWIARDERNADRVMQALRDFGFGGLRGLTRDDLLDPDTVIMLGVPPMRIDLLTSISGCTFGEAWRRRMRAQLGGRRVNVLGLLDLARNKRAAGRPKDLEDVRTIRALSSGSAKPTRTRRRAQRRGMGPRRG